MDASMITSLIGSLGFPIVMCLMLLFRMDKQDQQHSEITAKLTESINNNTTALTTLTAKLESKDII